MAALRILSIRLGIVLSLLLVSAPACKTTSSQEAFTPVSEQEVYDVINSLVKLRRLDTINAGTRRPFRVIDSLDMIKVRFSKASEPGLQPLHVETVVYQYLVSSSAKLFSKTDSAFFSFQNQNNKQIVLNADKFTAIKTISFSKWRATINNYEDVNGLRYSVLILTVPLFSNDHKKAYVRMGYHNGFGFGEEYFLVKIHNRWQIKLMEQTWIS